MATYSTYGSVRGCCGHRHNTIDAAEACLAKDQDGCRSQRGYSDRSVVEVDDQGRLYHDLAADEWIVGPGGRSCGAATLSD
jgi:hypothetical protein